MRRTLFWFVSGITFFKLSRLYCEQVTDNRPFAASHSSGTKPPYWTPLGHGKQKASMILNGNFLRLSCPSATFALKHCGFVPREWQAAKGLFRLPSYDVFKSPFRACVYSVLKKLFCRSGCLSLVWKSTWKIAALGKFTNNAILIVRNMFVITFKLIIISLVKNSSGSQGRSAESKPKRNRGKKLSRSGERAPGIIPLTNQC